MTLVAILLPSWLMRPVRRKTHKALANRKPLFELNNKVQESVSVIKVTKSLVTRRTSWKSFQAVNELTFQKNLQTMKYDVSFDPMVLVCWFLLCFNAFGRLDGSERANHGWGSSYLYHYLDMLVWPLMANGFLFNITQRGKGFTSGLRNCCLRNHPTRPLSFHRQYWKWALAVCHW